MKVLIWSSAVELFHALNGSGRFELTKTSGTQWIGEFDICIVDGNDMEFEEFKENYIEFPANAKTFYILPQHMIRSNIGAMKQALPNVFFLPPRMTANQITEQIILSSHDDVIPLDRNIHVFFGADSKVGTTMIAHSVAELIAQHTDVKVGILLFGNHSGNYIEIKDETIGIEHLKIKLFNNILTKDDLLQAAFIPKSNSNLLVIPGPTNLQDLRHYHPEHAEKLLTLAGQCVDILIVDAGCEVERGLSLGAIRMASNKYLVTTQQQHAKERFLMQDDQVFAPLQIEKKQFFCIINKYMEGGVSEKHISSMYNMAVISKVPYLNTIGWQAELDKKTLLNYKESIYNEAVEHVAQYVCDIQKIAFRATIKKGRWFK